MLRNGNNIIKNGDRIFESQVVESYLNMNSRCTQYPRMTTSGVTASDPLYVYYQTPTEVLKDTYTTDLNNTSVNFPLCDNNCVKNYYFCGNLSSVQCIGLYSSGLDGKWSGNFSCSINQFPQIECVNYACREVDFNEDISNTVFPRTLKSLCVRDCGITGDLTTVENFGSIEELWLCRTQFTGNMNEIEFNSLRCTDICYLPSGFQVNLNALIDDNPNYTFSTMCQLPGASMCADNLDISQLTYLNWNLPYADVKGTLSSNLDFNTGMTRFNLGSCAVSADLSNWDISGTQICWFRIYNYYGNCGEICGDISGWSFPSEMEIFLLDYARDVTAVPSDWCGLTPNLRQIGLQQMQALSGDVTTWSFPDSVTSVQLYQTELTGNLEAFDFPTGLTSVQMRNSNFTGDIGNLALPSGSSQFYLNDNCLCGNPSDMTIPPATTYLDLGGNDNVYWDLNTPFDTCNLYYLRMNNISGITGSFNNLTVGDAVDFMCFSSTPIESCLTDLNLNDTRYFYANSALLSQDITNMFTGDTSQLYQITMNANINLSGDTGNWDVDQVNSLQISSTALSGRLCIVNPFCLDIASTNICSCIDTDLCFASNSYNIALNNSKVQGCLSGVSLNYSNIYQFIIHTNPDLYGANDFTDTIFDNRGNFNRSYVGIQYNSIGDFVTGDTEQLGSLGTYGGDPSGMDLTEAQVNNLVAGIDYDGGGSNTPWDSKNKLWWIKNACVSSSSTTKRYSQFGLTYSYS